MLTLVGLGAISSGFQETLSDRQGNIPSTQHTMLSLTRAITIVVGFFFQFNVQVLQDFPLKYFMAADGDLCSLLGFSYGHEQ